MSKQYFLLGIVLLLSMPSFSQISFSNQTSALLSDTTVYSGVAMGIADMNGDSLDDIIRLHNARTLRIEYQQADGSTFSSHVHGTMGSGSQWSLCIADVDSNGYNDILAGGAYNSLKLLKADATGSSYTQTTLSNPSIFLQGSNFVDIDNNGSIDIFACHDDGLSAPFSNDGAGNFTHDIGLIDASSTVPSDNSGNYGSIWTDYDNDGDLDLYLSKCRLGVSNAQDGRRLNQLFQNDGNNNFTDVAEAAGLLPLAQSWAADFADVDNDGDLDCFIINHDSLSQIYINDGSGVFTDVTAASGMSSDLAGTIGIQCMFEDFDNDGFVDLLYTARSGNHFLFKNDGDFTFTTVTDPFPSSGLRIQSAVTGDLNNDGYIDVFAGFAGGFNGPSSSRPDKVFINEESGANYLKLLLKGDTCNINAIGTRAEIYGAWGTQVREIRSGESYGIMSSMQLHFGLGTATEVDSLLIRWPNGVVDKICGIEANQSLALTENNLPNLLTSNFTFVDDIFEVDFTNTSQGIADEQVWDFGDGTSSTAENPTHIFPDAGPYTVSLTISNDCETDVYMTTIGLGPLPLDLLSFSASLAQKDKVLIQWRSENEIDFDYYELQRSRDLQAFKIIATVAGNNVISQSQYEWLDHFPETGDNYYRLKQVDQDGRFSYSEWVNVKLDPRTSQIKIYPNPATDQLFISTASQAIQSLSLYDATGKEIRLQQILSNDFDFELNLSGFESGLYFIKIETKDEIQFLRFTKI